MTSRIDGDSGPKGREEHVIWAGDSGLFSDRAQSV